MESQSPSTSVPHASAPPRRQTLSFLCVFPEIFCAYIELGIFSYMNDNLLYVLCCPCIFKAEIILAYCMS